MASISNLISPDLITPVYNDIILSVSALGDISEIANYFIITINVGSEIRELKIIPNIDGIIEVNINKILKQFLTTKIFINTTPKDIIPDSIINYTYSITAYFDDTEITTNSGDYYTFIGVTNELFDYEDYIMNVGNYTKLLNTRKGGLITKLDEPLSIQMLNGNFDGIISDFNDVIVRTYYNDGTTNQETYSTGVNTTLGIVSLDISTTSLAANTSLVFDNTLLYYSIIGSSNTFEIIYVYVDNIDIRFERYFRFAYISSLGATDYINFNKGYEISLDISKDLYENNNIIKQYNNNVLEKTNVISDYMSAETSNSLKDLWVSPLIKEVSGIYNREIILEVSEIMLKHKKNEKLISYQVPFMYGDKYKIIKL